MATKARGGFGGKLYREDTPGSGTFTAIAEQVDIDGPSITQQLVDVTNMDSPNGWVEKVPSGVNEAGDVSFSCNLIDNDATHASLIADNKSRTLRNWRLVYPSGTRRVSFTAYVADVGNTVPTKGVMRRSVKLTLNGEVIYEAHP